MMHNVRWKTCNFEKMYLSVMRRNFVATKVCYSDFRRKWRSILNEVVDSPKKAKKSNNFEHSESTLVTVLKAGPESMASLSIECSGIGGKSVSLFDVQGSVFHHQVCNLRPKIKRPKNLFFSSIDESKLISCLAPNFFFGEDVINVYGPKGIHKALDTVCHNFKSTLRHNQILSCLAVNELHSDTMDVKDNDLGIKMVEIVANRIPTISYIINLSLVCVGISSKKCLELGINLNKNPKDFMTSEDYIQYKEFVACLKAMKPAMDPETGLTILPEEISEKPKPSKLLYVCCPTPNHFLELQRSKYFLQLDGVKMVAHMVPNYIATSYQYKKWTSIFPPDCTHIWLDSNKTEPSLLYPEIHRKILHNVDPVLFPMHGKDGSMKNLTSSLSSLVQNSCDPYTYNIGDEVKTLRPNTHRFQQMLERSEYYASRLALLEPTQDAVASKQYPRLIVLGSGGPDISRVRAGPSYFLQTTPESSILIDCSLASYTQMYHHFGPDEIKKVLRTIKVIFVSHRHLDHFGGLLEMMLKIRQNSKHQKIFVLLPVFTLSFVRKYCTAFDHDNLNYIVPHELSSQKENQLNRMAALLNIKYIKPVQVDHGVKTHGVVLQGRDWKVVYSSDTLPMCKNLISEGFEADLLIHDCLYFFDNHRLETKLKRHSVRTDAIETAHAMKAKNLLLTHFSGSNPLVAPIDLHDKGAYRGNVLCAMDNMELTMDTLSRYTHTHEMLQTVFSTTIERFLENHVNTVKKTEHIKYSYEQIKKIGQDL